MTIIKVENLSREFHIVKRESGFMGGLKSLVHRDYTVKKAVHNISMDIQKGEIVGYLGPNGAGKSTTIKMMVGILVPTSGSIEINGLNPYKNRKEHAKNIGIVFGQRTQLWWDIPVSETLKLLKYMYKIPEVKFRENLTLFFDILGIEEFYDIPVRQLSLGQRMRADICCSLIHNPDILFLDEPTIGLDVVVKEKIRGFIKEINRTNKTTVILTTHDMQDIEKLCSRVIIIDKGSIMFDGSLNYLKETFGNKEVIIADTVTPIKDINKLNLFGVHSVESNVGKLVIAYDNSKVSSSTIISKILEKTMLKDIKIIEAQTEEIIRNMYDDISVKSKVGGL